MHPCYVVGVGVHGDFNQNKLSNSLGRATAFSLIEVVGATAIVGGLLVVAMSTLGASKARQNDLAVRTRAALLAQDFIAEMLQLAYEEPDDPVEFVSWLLP